MRHSRLNPASLLLGFVALAIPPAAAANAQSPVGIYELRTYTAVPGRLDDVIARFANHTRALFEKHGMINIVYWVPIEADGAAPGQLIYLLGHASREAAHRSWHGFIHDPAWIAARDATEANGAIVASVASLYLTPTDFSPALAETSSRAGIVEMRTYKAAAGKLAALDARFREHTLKLFAKHGMTNGPYFHPADTNGGSADTLIYWLTHENRAAAEASWKAFRADPEWLAARTASEIDGTLTISVTSIFLRPVAFTSTK